MEVVEPTQNGGELLKVEEKTKDDSVKESLNELSPMKIATEQKEIEDEEPCLEEKTHEESRKRALESPDLVAEVSPKKALIETKESQLEVKAALQEEFKPSEESTVQIVVIDANGCAVAVLNEQDKTNGHKENGNAGHGEDIEMSAQENGKSEDKSDTELSEEKQGVEDSEPQVKESTESPQVTEVSLQGGKSAGTTTASEESKEAPIADDNAEPGSKQTGISTDEGIVEEPSFEAKGDKDSEVESKSEEYSTLESTLEDSQTLESKTEENSASDSEIQENAETKMTMEIDEELSDKENKGQSENEGNDMDVDGKGNEEEVTNGEPSDVPDKIESDQPKEESATANIVGEIETKEAPSENDQSKDLAGANFEENQGTQESLEESKQEIETTPEVQDSSNVSSSVDDSKTWTLNKLAWARYRNFPFWPCVVTQDPETGKMEDTQKQGRSERRTIHVQYFGDNGRRNWVPYANVIPFTGLADYLQLAKKANKSSKKFYSVKSTLKKKWNVAVEEATSFLDKPFDPEFFSVSTPKAEKRSLSDDYSEPSTSSASAMLDEVLPQKKRQRRH